MGASLYITEGSDPRKAARAILRELERAGGWRSFAVSHRGKRRAERIARLIQRELAEGGRALDGHWDFGEEAFFGAPGFAMRLRILDRAADAYLAGLPDVAFVADTRFGGSAILSPFKPSR